MVLALTQDVSASADVPFVRFSSRLQRKEEEPYTCARSCGCPTSFDWRERKWQDIVDWGKNNRVEWLAGITTGLTAVPTAVAFAILAGVSPSVGLRGTWIIMLVMSLFGGEDCCARVRSHKFRCDEFVIDSGVSREYNKK